MALNSKLICKYIEYIEIFNRIQVERKLQLWMREFMNASEITPCFCCLMEESCLQPKCRGDNAGNHFGIFLRICKEGTREKNNINV